MGKTRQQSGHSKDQGDNGRDGNGPGSSTPTQSTLGNQATGAGLGGSAQSHEVVRGDTLWSLSKRYYGAGRHWRQIMAANPGKVQRGGDLIFVGDALVIPALDLNRSETGGGDSETGQTAGPGSTGGTVDLGPEDADGGDVAAVEPTGICTEFGDFLMYPDSTEGELPASAEPGVEVIREGELDGIVAKRRAAAEAEREVALAEIEDLLSYGAFDWAITDAEATRAVALLGGLHFTQLGPALTQMGSTSVQRLLDNVPSGTRSTPAFARIVVALGPDQVGPYIEELLSYGLFDWAITDSEMDALAEVILMLPAEQQVEVLADLDETFVNRLLGNFPGGSGNSDQQNQVLLVLWDETGDSDVDRLQRVMQARFGIDVGELSDESKRQGIAWEAGGLRRTWDVLIALPAAHVEGNSSFDELLRYVSLDKDGNVDAPSSAGGFFRGRSDVVAMAYNDQNLEGTNSAAQPGEPLYGVNRFDKVVRHEVGHAVDERMNASGTYCATSDGGGWQEHGSDYDTVLDAAFGAAGTAVNALSDSETESLRDLLEDLMSDSDTSDFRTELDTLFSAKTESERDDIEDDDAVQVVLVGMDNPWYNAAGGGIDVGGRVYEESYGNDWNSYATASRGKKVSDYQHRAPGEWFAEVYATYYEPHDDGPGALLQGTDPVSRTWFDNNVHNLAADR